MSVSRIRPAGHWPDWPDTTYGTVPGAFFEQTDQAVVELKNEKITVTDLVYGASTGTGSDDTAAFNAAVAASAGKTLLIPDGTYLVNPIVVASAMRIELQRGATVKLINSATEVSSQLGAFIITSSNVELVGGTIDGNRAGQSKTTYNAAGGANVKSWNAVRVVGTSGSHLSNVTVRTTIINAVDFGLHALYCDKLRVDVAVSSSGGAGWLQFCDDLSTDRLVGDTLDNDAWKTYPHAIDIYFCNRPVLDNLRVTNQSGNDSIAGGTALSDSVSGITMTGCRDVQGTNWLASCSLDATTNRGVGISTLDNTGRITNLHVEKYRELLLELGSDVDFEISNFHLDGYYNCTSANSNVQAGLALLNDGYYSNFLHRTMRFTERCRLTNGTIQRCTDYGIGTLAARDCTFVNVKVRACRRGLQSQLIYANTEDNFASQPFRDLLGNTYIGCDFSYNELHGIDLTDLRDSKFIGCKAHNNGQANAYPGGSRRNGSTVADASGIHSATGTGARVKSGLEFVSCDAQDTEGWTDHLSCISTNPKVLSVQTESLYQIGQTIKLVAAGPAAADLYTRINAIDKDEITVDDAVSTFTSVAGAGTLSTSGTTVTGSSTLFNTELQGRYWITAGGNTRQINKVSTNTAAVLDVAFPTNLSGASYSITKITSAGTPCQKYGLSLDASMLSPVVVGGNYAGNVSLQIRDLTVAPTAAYYVGVPAKIPTGWAAATGTATRSTFDTATVTLPVLAQHFKALVDDFIVQRGLNP